MSNTKEGILTEKSDSDGDFRTACGNPAQGSDRSGETAGKRVTGSVLSLYLRDMGNVPQFTSEQEAQLWGKIDESLTCIRNAISRFGFVFEEIIRLLSDEDIDDFGDIFCSSGDRSVRDTVVAPEEYRKWKIQLEKFQSEFKRAVLSAEGENEELTRLREEGVILLNKHPVLPEKIIEWLEVAEHYLSMKNSGEIDAAHLRERLLMDESAARKIIEECRIRKEIFEQWKMKILESNLKLVITLAKPYQGKGLPLDDLIQEGNIGLMKALEKFDYRLGHRFCTYASWWIKEGIAKALSAQTRVIRLPVHMVNTIRKMRIAEKNFIQQNGCDPEDRDIARILELPEERVRAIRKMSTQCISLQAPRNREEENNTIENILSDSENDDPMKAYARKLMRQRLEVAIAKLTERERMVISMRYGLNDNVCRSLSEVSKAFHITRERVRQIELRTLEKLRKHSRQGTLLDDFYLS